MSMQLVIPALHSPSFSIVFTVFGRRFFIALLLAFSSSSYSGMIDKEGMQAWEICAMCHNANGISRMAKFPKLAGQKAAYTEQQINAFREGRRHNDGGQMQSIVGEVAQEDVASIAAYFASLPQDTDLGKEEHDIGEKYTQKISQGQLLFQSGREGISSCASCHTDKSSNAPWLDGQHKQYLEKQMHDFISGDRESACSISKSKTASQEMHLIGISEQLDDSEIEALALYLSNLSLDRK